MEDQLEDGRYGAEFHTIFYNVHCRLFALDIVKIGLKFSVKFEHVSFFFRNVSVVSQYALTECHSYRFLNIEKYHFPAICSEHSSVAISVFEK